MSRVGNCNTLYRLCCTIFMRSTRSRAKRISWTNFMIFSTHARSWLRIRVLFNWSARGANYRSRILRYMYFSKSYIKCYVIISWSVCSLRCIYYWLLQSINFDDLRNFRELSKLKERFLKKKSSINKILCAITFRSFCIYIDLSVYQYNWYHLCKLINDLNASKMIDIIWVYRIIVYMNIQSCQ